MINCPEPFVLAVRKTSDESFLQKSQKARNETSVGQNNKFSLRKLKIS